MVTILSVNCLRNVLINVLICRHKKPENPLKSMKVNHYIKESSHSIGTGNSMDGVLI